jgi:PAS domain S-box-containing protein
MSAASQRTAFKPPAAEILMFAGDGIMAADQEGRVLLCNRAAEEIFGYAAEELLGLPIETLARRAAESAPATGPWARARWRARAGRAGRAPAHAGQRRHGREFPVEATLSRREIEGHMVLIAVVRDATEREAERLLLRELQHRMKNAPATVQALAVQTMQSSPRPRRSSRPSPDASPRWPTPIRC